MRKIRTGKRTIGTLCKCAVVVAALIFGSARSAESYRSEAVKAAFLYRFTGYIEWPESALQTDHFTIAVLGSDAVSDELSELMAQRHIKNLPARVRLIESARQVEGAHILYVGPEYSGDLQALAVQLATQPTLIVTEHARGLDQGGVVNFLMVDRRVRFEVSLAAARRRGIKVSSELLSVAARVRGVSLRAPMPCVPPFPPNLHGECAAQVAQL